MKLQSKIYKYFFFTFLLSSLLATITYYKLSNRHKAIIKTFLLHKTGIIDNDWVLNHEKHQELKMRTPSFLIDGIYKSMEGPKASKYIQFSEKDELIWMKGFQVKAYDSKSNQQISNDFICHMNIDINETQYYENFNLKDRIGKSYPRLTSLSNGLESFEFPKGYAVPIKANHYLFVTSQSLNLNIPKISKQIKHEVIIKYDKSSTYNKPLFSKTVFIQLPYNKYDPYKEPLDPASNQCIPLETKNHSYEDNDGNVYSGHWVITKGENSYRSSINHQLQIKDSLRLHFSAPHVHAFATSISLFDKTTNKFLFSCKVTNHKNKMGLQKIETFSCVDGLWLYKDHEYELVLTTNNTSKINQDMMGSMFLFFYDKELEEKLEKMKKINI